MSLPAIARCGDPMPNGTGLPPCCPSLYVYSDGEFIYELTFSVTGTEDMCAYHIMETLPEEVDGVYTFLLVEGNGTSHIDKVYLTIGDQLAPLISAKSNNDNVMPELLVSDDNKVTLTEIDLEFIALPHTGDYIFHIEGYTEV